MVLHAKKNLLMQFCSFYFPLKKLMFMFKFGINFFLNSEWFELDLVFIRG